jgi:hypothetical protein
LPYRAPTEQDGRGFNKHSHASLAQFQSAPPFELPTRGTR